MGSVETHKNNGHYHSTENASPTDKDESWIALSTRWLFLTVVKCWKSIKTTDLIKLTIIKAEILDLRILRFNPGHTEQREILDQQ